MAKATIKVLTIATLIILVSNGFDVMATAELCNKGYGVLTGG